MKASELRQMTAQELSGRVKTWQKELFQLKFKNQSAEARDTSSVGKLRREVARALTVLKEKTLGIEVPVKAAAAPTDDVPLDKPAKKKTAKKVKEGKKDE